MASGRSASPSPAEAEAGAFKIKAARPNGWRMARSRPPPEPDSVPTKSYHAPVRDRIARPAAASGRLSSRERTLSRSPAAAVRSPRRRAGRYPSSCARRATDRASWAAVWWVPAMNRTPGQGSPSCGRPRSTARGPSILPPGSPRGSWRASRGPPEFPPAGTTAAIGRCGSPFPR